MLKDAKIIFNINNYKSTPIEELRTKREKLNFMLTANFKYLENPKWTYFYPKKSYFKFRVSPYSYFDPRPEVSSNVTSVIIILILLISLFTLSITWFHLLLLPFIFFGWGDFYLYLPFDTGKYNEAENPYYGF